MAQRVQVMVVCDLHDDETPATETVRFSFDGAPYEIDLCEAHVARFRDVLATYVGAARRAAGRGSRGRSRPGRLRPNEVREWARKQGIEVSKRGRIPSHVIEQYDAAH